MRSSRLRSITATTVVALGGAVAISGIRPAEAIAGQALPTDCFFGFTDHFGVGSTICATGDVNNHVPIDNSLLGGTSYSICPEGYVFIIPEGYNSHTDVTTSTPTPGVTSENYVVGCGIGGSFFEILVWNGAQVGRYEMVVDEYPFGPLFGPEDGNVRSRFDVSKTAPAINLLNVAQTKARAEENRQHARNLELWGQIIKYVDAAEDASELLAFGPGAFGVFFVAIVLCDTEDLAGVPTGFDVGFCPSEPYPPFEALDGLIGLTRSLQKQYQGIVNDPPDPNFLVMAPLDLESLGLSAAHPYPSSDEKVRRLVAVTQLMAIQSGAYAAMLPTLEKLQGADAANDPLGRLLQSEQLRMYATIALSAHDAMTPELDALEQALSASGELSITHDGTQLGAAAARVLTSGFTAEELGVIKSFAFSDEEIAAGLSRLARTGIPATTSYSLILDAFRQSNASMRPALLDLIAQADRITLEEAPIVFRPHPIAEVTGASNGVVGVSVPLHGSATYFDPLALLTYSWDLDLDGDFDDAAGEDVAFLPAAPGMWVVGLRVQDSVGKADIAYHALSILPSNAAPRIVGRVPDDLSPSAGVGQPIAFSIVAEDQDNEPLNITWFVDGSSQATGPSFAFIMPDEAPHFVEVVVEDTDPFSADARAAFAVRPVSFLQDDDGDGTPNVTDTCRDSSNPVQDLSSDVNNCGTCGLACTAPNGISACIGGACALVGCEAGFSDCNSLPGDGCEYDDQLLATDENNCGVCRRACTAEGAFCEDGACVTVVVIGAPPPAAAVCGDGRVDALEQCDDGNTIGGDGCSAACAVEGALSSKGTFLRTDGIDSPAPPLILDLAALRLFPGDTLELGYEIPSPGFSYFGCGGPFVGVNGVDVLGVFSASSTLLARTEPARVPGAIEAGSNIGSGPTHFGQQPNDIPQDFRIGPAGFTIEVPLGATHLFVGMSDSFFADNCGTIILQVKAADRRTLPSWWPANGNADDVLGGNDGMAINGATFAPGRDGQAFLLDGSDDAIRIPHSASLDVTGSALTVMAWVRPTGGPLASANIIVQKDVRGELNQRKFSLFTRAGSNTLGFLVQTTSGTVLGDKGTVPRNEWSHVAGVYDGSQMTWYINGCPVGSEPQTGNIVSTTTPVVIGNFQFSADGFTGLIDDVKMFDRALSSSDIANESGGGFVCPGTVCVPPPRDLVSWWTGDGNAIDLGGANEGSLENGTAFALGKVGDAFAFDGIDDFVNAGNAPNLHVSGGEFTVDAWVRFNALGHPPGANVNGAPQGDMSIVDKMQGVAGPNLDGWRLLKQHDNRFWFCLGGGTQNQCVNPSFTLFSTTRAETGVWYHVAVAKRTTGMSLYINGQLEDSRASLPTFTDTNAADVLIGANAREGAHLNGFVDEVEIHETALTESEIRGVYLAGSGGKCKSDLCPVAAPPVITCPAPVTVECTGSGFGALDPPEASASDECSTVTMTGPAVDSYPLGVSMLVYTATDETGHTAECTSAVVVEDTTPPSIACPGETRVECTESRSAPVVPMPAVAEDVCTDARVTNPGEGTYPLGTSALSYAATDEAGLVASCTSLVTVEDTTPPVITVATTRDLWPPNHTYQRISLADCGITSIDVCSGPLDASAARITCVTSDEPENARQPYWSSTLNGASGGDGSTVGDIVIVDDQTVALRAERLGGGDGRVYQIHFEVRDPEGNAAEGVCNVMVRQSQNGAVAVDSGAQLTVCR